MAVYGHTDDKSKHLLGEASDLYGIANNTAFGGIRKLYTQLRANNRDFQFAYSGGKYGYIVDGQFIPFKNPVGAMSITANGTYNVTDYAQAVVNIQPPQLFLDTVGGNGDPWWTCAFPRALTSYKFIICHSANYQYVILQNYNGSWVAIQGENFAYRNFGYNTIEFAQTTGAGGAYRAYAIG